LSSPPANQCVRLAPSEAFGNADSLRSGRAVNGGGLITTGGGARVGGGGGVGGQVGQRPV
jgi:hypothetical protein